MKKLIFLFVVSIQGIFAASVHLINDTPYILTAVIHGANGVTLASVVMQPGEDTRWENYNLPNYPTSLTPFTVIWKCEDEGDYSVCIGITSGGIAKPSLGDGTKYCKPKEKKEKAKQ